MKTIGVMPLYDDEKESVWMLPAYLKMLENAGAAPIVLPFTDNESVLHNVYNLCDGILLTGGHDVSPKLYGEDISLKCGAVCEIRDRMESFILGSALADDKPVLGICRGLQFLNVFLGGTLYQDLPSEFKSNVSHKMSRPYDRAAHSVQIFPDTPLFEMIGKSKIAVNSYHHQAVKRLSERLRKCALSEDGLIEAAYMPEKRFVFAVQWHPEFSFGSDPNSRKIVEAFIRS